MKNLKAEYGIAQYSIVKYGTYGMEGCILWYNMVYNSIGPLGPCIFGTLGPLHLLDRWSLRALGPWPLGLSLRAVTSRLRR